MTKLNPNGILFGIKTTKFCASTVGIPLGLHVGYVHVYFILNTQAIPLT